MVKTSLRAARQEDAQKIRELIHRVGINPAGLDWRRFTIVEDESGSMVGCGQLKPHGRDIVELASIAVVPEFQQNGVGSSIIGHLLQKSGRPVYLMCRAELRTFYERFGFRTLQLEEMPGYFQRIRKVLAAYELIAGVDATVLIMKLQ